MSTRRPGRLPPPLLAAAAAARLGCSRELPRVPIWDTTTSTFPGGFSEAHRCRLSSSVSTSTSQLTCTFRKKSDRGTLSPPRDRLLNEASLTPISAATWTDTTS